MSLILDALKKSEKERKLGLVDKPAYHAPDGTPEPDNMAPPEKPRRPWALLVLAGIILAAGGGYVWEATKKNGAESLIEEETATTNPAPSTPKVVVPAEEKPAPVTTSPVKTETPPAKPKLPELASAEAYANRGWEAVNKGLFNQALSDFDLALGMEPGFILARFGRGWANEKQGDFDQAMMDYQKVLDLAPDHADAAIGHGVLLTYQGLFDQAATDFERAFNIADETLRPYAFLWLVTAQARAGTMNLDDLDKKAVDMDLTPWPGVLIRHILGHVNITAVLKEADHDDRDQRRERMVVTYYFLGEQALAEGLLAEAKGHFEKALATGMADYRQFAAAQKALDKINN